MDNLDETSARLGDLLAKATQGKWSHLGYCGQDGVIHGPRQFVIAATGAIAGSTMTGHQNFHNAALIVAAVNALPAILAEREADKAEIARLRGASIGLRDDLLERAEWDDDAVKVVCAGNGAWRRFNDALEPEPKDNDNG